MTSNSDCSGVSYVTKPFRTCYYWITKKFVEVQGNGNTCCGVFCKFLAKNQLYPNEIIEF